MNFPFRLLVGIAIFGVAPPARGEDADAALVQSLLGENLSARTFSFATVAYA